MTNDDDTITTTNDDVNSNGDNHASSDYDAIFADFWRWRLTESPYYATLCGDESQKGRLDSWSPESKGEALEFGRKLIERLRRLKKSEDVVGAIEGGTASASLDVDLLLHELETYVNGLETNAFCFPVGRFDGPIAAVNRMLQNARFDSDEDFENALSVVEAVPRALDEVTEAFRRGIEIGMTFHRETLDRLVANRKKTRDAKADEFPWVVTLKRRLGGAGESGRDGDDDENKLDDGVDLDGNVGDVLDDKLENDGSVEKYLDRVKSVVDSDVRPSLSRLIEFLEEEYSAHARADISVASLPVAKGKPDLYSQCLRFHIDVDSTPKQVHDLGWEEIRRIEAEMQATIKEIGFEGSDSAQFADLVKSQPTSYFSSSEELLAFVRSSIHDRVIPSLSKCFVDVPQFPFEIRPVVGNAAAPMGYYAGGTADKKSPGVFSINLDMFSTVAKCVWLSLILHEAIPGHHLQDIYSLDAEDIPTYRQVMDGGHYIEVPARFPTHCAFGEGWALYAESLGKELGVYTDPMDYYGKLLYEMLRAVRLVVDTGLHAFGWTLDQAERFFCEKLKMLSPQSAKREIERYIAIPGQSCSYKIGEIAIWKARRRAEAELGEKFDLRQFHKAILTRGFIPLTALETIVDGFIAECREEVSIGG